MKRSRFCYLARLANVDYMASNNSMFINKRTQFVIARAMSFIEFVVIAVYCLIWVVCVYCGWTTTTTTTTLDATANDDGLPACALAVRM